MPDLSPLVPGPRYDGSAVDISHAWFDVDNTLVNNNRPELPTPQFLAAAFEAGKVAVLALATARPLEKSQHIIAASKLEGLSILSNGAQILNGATGEMLLERPLPLEPTMDIVRTLQEQGIDHWVQDNGKDHFWLHGDVARKDRTASNGLGDYAATENIWEPVSESNKLLVPAYTPQKPFVVVAHDISAAEVKKMQEIARQYADQHITSLLAHEMHKDDGTVGYEVFFIDDRANKREALLTVLEETRVARERSMAAGDGPNDTVIVENAGIGVAMGNAVEATKAVSTYIAPSFDKNGAAITLQKLVLKK